MFEYKLYGQIYWIFYGQNSHRMYYRTCLKLHVMLVKPSNLMLRDVQNLICGESAATEKVPSCYSLIVKRTTAISRKRKQCPMSWETCSVLLNMRFKQMDSIWTFVAISGEFLHLNTRIHYESQTKTICRVNETPHETWQSAGASGTRHFSIWHCICLIWQNLMIRFTTTLNMLILFPQIKKIKSFQHKKSPLVNQWTHKLLVVLGLI